MGYRPWALLTDVLVPSQHGPLLTNRFSDLAPLDSERAIDLDALRLQVEVRSNQRRFAAEVARALLRATTSRTRLYVRARDNEAVVWTMSPKDLLFADAFQRHLPLASTDEIEILEAELRWYIRLRGDDPFVFLAAGPELDRALERLSSPSAARLALGATFGLAHAAGVPLPLQTREAGIS